MITTNEYFFPYGIPSLIIGILVAIIYASLEKFLKSDSAVKIKGYLPFLTGILLNFLYSLITKGFSRSISIDTVYYGLLSGSFGALIFALFKKIKSGKITTDEICLIIEEILLNVLRPDQALTVSLEIKKLLEQDFDEIELLSKIEQTVKEFSDGEISKEDLTSLFNLILCMKNKT